MARRTANSLSSRRIAVARSSPGPVGRICWRPSVTGPPRSGILGGGWASRLAAGEGKPFDPAACARRCRVPGSGSTVAAFRVHADLMQVAYGPTLCRAIGRSCTRVSPTASTARSSPFPSAAKRIGIDFEGEYGVIVDTVPMGTRAAEAQTYIKLVVQINDWSLRNLALPEMKTGFGWIQAERAGPMAAYAVTPDALGEAWRDGRVCLDLAIDWNGKRFGNANGREMGFGFHELIAHAARDA